MEFSNSDLSLEEGSNNNGQYITEDGDSDIEDVVTVLPPITTLITKQNVNWCTWWKTWPCREPKQYTCAYIFFNCVKIFSIMLILSCLVSLLICNTILRVDDTGVYLGCFCFVLYLELVFWTCYTCVKTAFPMRFLLCRC